MAHACRAEPQARTSKRTGPTANCARDVSVVREGSTLHWVIARQDLAERRFDRAHVSFFWNP
jgi:hypothetical protein